MGREGWLLREWPQQLVAGLLGGSARLTPLMAVFVSCLVDVDSCCCGMKQKRALVAIPEIPPDWCLVQRTGHCERGLPTDCAFAAVLEPTLTLAALQNPCVLSCIRRASVHRLRALSSPVGGFQR